MKTSYLLFVLVDSDEGNCLGVIPQATYDAWNEGDIDTDHNDHCGLFWSEHVTQRDSYDDCLTFVASLNGEIVGVIGGLAY